MRVLLAFEDEYRAYMEAMAVALRTFRSNVEVALTDGRNLDAEVARFDPQLLISSPPVPENPVDEEVVARIELSPEPTQASRFRVGERRWETTNPTLGEILPVVEEAKRHFRTSHDKEATDTSGAEG
jgi:hypothetical protein